MITMRLGCNRRGEAQQLSLAQSLIAETYAEVCMKAILLLQTENGWIKSKIDIDDDLINHMPDNEWKANHIGEEVKAYVEASLNLNDETAKKNSEEPKRNRNG